MDGRRKVAKSKKGKSNGGKKEHRDGTYGIESVQPNNYPYSFNRKSRWGNILQGGLVGIANGLNAGMVESSHLDGQAQNSIS